MRQEEKFPKIVMIFNNNHCDFCQICYSWVHFIVKLSKIYTIVKGKETFYRRHTVPVASCTAQPQSEANFCSSEVKNKFLSILFLHAFSYFIYKSVGVIE